MFSWFFVVSKFVGFNMLIIFHMSIRITLERSKAPLPQLYESSQSHVGERAAYML